MDLQELDESVEFYFWNALAPSTRKTYQSAKTRYLKFCTKGGFPPLPLSEHQLCQYASYLTNDSVSHSSIKSYLSAIRHLQIAQGMADPGIACMAKLEQVLKGIKVHQAKAMPGRQTRLLITPEIMKKLRLVWEEKANCWNNIMLWAAACTSFFGFLRAGEMTISSEASYDAGAHLNFADVAIDNPSNPSILRLRLKASKTDPFQRGVDIFIGRTHNELCPIEAMLAYLAKRGGRQGFLFLFEDGRLLTRDRFVRAVREALAKAGVDQRSYADHSFRIGAVTTAARCGIHDSIIKMLGRWKSAAYLRYIQTPRDQLANLSSLIAKPPPLANSKTHVAC